VNWKHICQIASGELERETRSFLVEEFYHEWNEWRCFMYSALADEEFLTELRQYGPPQFTMAQWKASLSYLAMCEHPEKATFSFVDAGILIALQFNRWRGNQNYLRFCMQFFEIQKLIRTALDARHELMSGEADAFLKKIRTIKEEGKKFSPNFGPMPSQETTSTKVRAA